MKQVNTIMSCTYPNVAMHRAKPPLKLNEQIPLWAKTLPQPIAGSADINAPDNTTQRMSLVALSDVTLVR